MTDNQRLLIREAVEAGLVFLRSQQDIALASDQRAMNLCGFFVASAAVLAGLAISGDTSNALRIMSMALSGALVIAARFAFYAAQPREFNVPGYLPSMWNDDIAVSKDIDVARREVLDSLERRITENNALIDHNAALLEKAVTIAGLAVLAFALVSTCVISFGG